MNFRETGGSLVTPSLGSGEEDSSSSHRQEHGAATQRGPEAGEKDPRFKVVGLKDQEAVLARRRRLLATFIMERKGLSPRDNLKQALAGETFNETQEAIIKQAIANHYERKYLFSQPLPELPEDQETIPFGKIVKRVIGQGYAPTDPFVLWLYNVYGEEWNKWDWFEDMKESMSDVDEQRIGEEMRLCGEFELPDDLLLYYATSGLESIKPKPGKTLHDTINEMFAAQAGDETFKQLDIVGYFLDHYGRGLDRLDETISVTLFEHLRNIAPNLPEVCTVLGIGIGPGTWEGQIAVAAIPQLLNEGSQLILGEFDKRFRMFLERFVGKKN
ncbi:MAG: hypothetical protein AAB538_00745, partial [Patescibacteria group bacterium]